MPQDDVKKFWLTNLRLPSFIVLIFLTAVPFALFPKPIVDKADDRDEHLSLEFERLVSEVRDDNPQSKYEVFLFVFENQSSFIDEREQAVKLLGEAAEAGLDSAQFSLATLFRYGKWVKQDTDMALRWMLMAASEGFLEARIESAGLLFRYAINKDDEREKQKYLLESVSRMRSDLIRDDLSGEQELHLKMYLGRSLTHINPSDKEGWQFLAQAACQDYADAGAILSDDLEFFKKSAAEGDSRSGDILSIATSEISAHCAEPQIEKLLPAT